MDTSEDEDISADTLEGLDTVRANVEDVIQSEAAAHEYLDADALDIMGMYVVGSIGAGRGRTGSDLDLIVMLRYTGTVDAELPWDEYVQHDIENSLKQKRSTLAEPLPSYVGYIDPKLGDQIDCEMFLGQMTAHGGYGQVYDLYDRAFISADRF